MNKIDIVQSAGTCEISVRGLRKFVTEKHFFSLLRKLGYRQVGSTFFSLKTGKPYTDFDAPIVVHDIETDDLITLVSVEANVVQTTFLHCKDKEGNLVWSLTYEENLTEEEKENKRKAQEEIEELRERLAVHIPTREFEQEFASKDEHRGLKDTVASVERGEISKISSEKAEFGATCSKEMKEASPLSQASGIGKGARPKVRKVPESTVSQMAIDQFVYEMEHVSEPILEVDEVDGSGSSSDTSRETSLSSGNPSSSSMNPSLLSWNPSLSSRTSLRSYDSVSLPGDFGKTYNTPDRPDGAVSSSNLDEQVLHSALDKVVKASESDIFLPERLRGSETSKSDSDLSKKTPLESECLSTSHPSPLAQSKDDSSVFSENIAECTEERAPGKEEDDPCLAQRPHE